MQFSNVGMEYHPTTGLIYACTNDGNLYVLEEDASSSIIGETGLDACTNLGAPFGDPDLPEG